MIAAFAPASAAGTSATPSVASTRANTGASASGVSASSPKSSRHRSSTWSGVRKQVPELTSVVPPSPRPSGRTIGGEPTVAI
jgi:hypothetical protein